MLDLGNSFLGSVERDPQALAIVDGPVRLSYAQWYRRVSAIVAVFDELGLHPGDHLVTLLQNRWEAVTIHWACQIAGIISTPINWRLKADEIDYCVEDCEAKAIVFETVSAGQVRDSREAGARTGRLTLIPLGLRAKAVDDDEIDRVIEEDIAAAHRKRNSRHGRSMP